MLATIAVIGRPNVGKSTLFNRLLRRNKAITHDMPGVTRDRIYAVVRPKDEDMRPYGIIDTGGLVPDSDVDIERSIVEQAGEALTDSQMVLFVLDAREGLTQADEMVAAELRQSGKPVLVVANKVDGAEQEPQAAEFHQLGFEIVCISAAHGHGIPTLSDRIESLFEEHGIESSEPEYDPEKMGLRIAMLGRPNAGKSSMINALLGERRLIVSDEAGTTRDTVDVTFERKGKTYTFVDTAGVRRKGKIDDSLERFTVLRAIKAATRADVAILVLDGMESLSHQDKKLIALLDREKTPFIITVNKTDLVPKDLRTKLKTYFEEEFRFIRHVPVVHTSNITKAGLGGLLPLAEKIHEECHHRVGTGELNRIMQACIDRHQPPVVKRVRAKFYYLTQADQTPPTFVFFVNDKDRVLDSYKRYLEGQIRKLAKLTMCPVALHFRSSHNKKDKKGKKRR